MAPCSRGAQELSGLGFRVPKSTGATKEGLVALSALHEFSFRIDQSTQTLYVTAADESLLPQVLNAAANPDGEYAVESGTGVTLNYDLFGNSVDGPLSGSGLFDLRGVFAVGRPVLGVCWPTPMAILPTLTTARPSASIRPMCIPTRTRCGAIGPAISSADFCRGPAPCAWAEFR